jgi:hypothetical protein
MLKDFEIRLAIVPTADIRVEIEHAQPRKLAIPASRDQRAPNQIAEGALAGVDEPDR